ncbi:MAG: hypothetical protein LBP85_03245 [Prevotellaceae bacterium]|jgi:hypothetical protein|nr:hypothetical protein [Prevotellaceae bacterium]
MKKVSKKVQSTKLNEIKYFSLNGEMLKKLKGGGKGENLGDILLDGNTDNACYAACYPGYNH